MRKGPRPDWYLDPTQIKAKQNRDWTVLERRALYTMVVIDKKDITTVMSQLDISDLKKTVIYNQLRLQRRIEFGKGRFKYGACFKCGKAISKHDKESRRTKKALYLCTKCRKTESDLKKKLRRRALKKGLCGYCHKNPVYKRGAKSCIKCLSATHRRRYMENLCGQCGNNPISKNSNSLCEVCLDMNRVRNWETAHA